MSDPHPPASHETAKSDPLYFSKEVDNPVSLVIVYAAVIGLSLLSVGISSVLTTPGGRRYSLVIQLGIGAVQAALVAYHFMHLKQGDRVVVLTALSSIFWMGILFVLFLTDYMSRQSIVGW
jgi:cytochrome c oxidase subunit 4